ncbi:MAG: thiolase family protein [Spirochaetia bacterium]|nr:thiolase family protein [Spirochaetia bacterium]
MKFDRNGDKLVIAGAVRTPIGQAGKSLAKIQPYELGGIVTQELLKRTGIPKDKIECVVAGEINQSSKAPNVARVVSVKNEIPLKSAAVTIANNCVSGFEAINEAARRILLGECDTALVLGIESMSNMPIYLDGAKHNSKTATVQKLKTNWNEVPQLEDVKPVDSVEEGLTDPVRDAIMFETAEVVSQKLGLSKKSLDNFAHGSYRKTYDAIQAGKYKPYLIPVSSEKGSLENDEFIMSKTGFVEKPERFEKAKPIYEMIEGGIKEFYKKYGKHIGKEYEEGKTTGTVSLFNSCPQSDGAGALLLTTESKAKELGLKPLAYVQGWGNYGVDPVYMGLGIAYAMKQALENTGLSWDDIGFYEIHEAFAATALGSIMVVTDEFNYNLMARYDKGDINRNGGTLAMGHPLGATGIRIAINQLLELEHEKNSTYSMGAICAGGGVGGALILKRV